MRPDNEEELIRGRFAVSILLTLVVGALLLFRLFDLQIVQGTTLEETARQNRTRELIIPAPRGRILDANGVVLAYTRSAFTVSLLDEGNGNVAKVVPILAQILGVDEKEILEKMATNSKFSRMWPIRLTSGISDVQHVQIFENMEKLPGVSIDYIPIERIYPYGSALSHVLGYLGAIDPSDWDEWAMDAGYSPNELVGKKGLERAQESWLHGTPGRYLVEIDAFNNFVQPLSRIEPVPGNDIYLTIDINFQSLAEDLLIKSLSTVRLQPNPDYRAASAFCGSVVALNTEDGSILAMVSYPDYDPNAWSTGQIIDPELRRLYFELAVSEETGEEEYQPNLEYPSPQFNRAILAALPPGSSYKPITLAAALEYGVTTSSETVFCSGTYEHYADVGLRPHCWVYPAGAHQSVNGAQALQLSCNCYFFEMGRRLGIENLDRYAAAFGLGEDTGFRDLVYVAEDNYESTHRSNADYKEWAYENGYGIDYEWYDGETIFTAIGQGYNAVSPLQMALMTETIANEGTRLRPYLVDRVVNHEGKLLYKTQVVEQSVLQLKPSTWSTIRTGMIAVTKRYGTSYDVTFGLGAERLNLWDGLSFDVAGKTGTAQLGNDDPNDLRAHAWFTAFAPADNPKIAIAMLVENGRSGSYACGPTVSTLLREYLGEPKLQASFIEDAQRPWPPRYNP